MIAACPAPPAAIYACAPTVCWVTIKAVVAVESGGRPWVLHDNTTGISYRAGSRAQAASWARWLIARGHSLDVGLGQINSANLRRFGISPAAALDSCTNLRLAGRILSADYGAAMARWQPGQWALLHAISAYHHGSLQLDRRYLARYRRPVKPRDRSRLRPAPRFVSASYHYRPRTAPMPRHEAELRRRMMAEWQARQPATPASDSVYRRAGVRAPLARIVIR
jgi:hypothetical protein